jgi:hypothetical protein
MNRLENIAKIVKKTLKEGNKDLEKSLIPSEETVLEILALVHKHNLNSAKDLVKVNKEIDKIIKKHVEAS